MKFNGFSATIVVVVLLAFPTAASAQIRSQTQEAVGSSALEVDAAQELMKKGTLVLTLLPDRALSPGPELVYTNFEIDGTDITAMTTMNGRGRDGCTIEKQMSGGTVEGNRVGFRVVVPEGNTKICRTSVVFTILPDGNCVGTYKRPPSGAGRIIKCK